MDIPTSQEAIIEVKWLLVTHMEWLKGLWQDLQLFQELATKHPDEDYSDTQQLLLQAIEQEQHAIVNIKRGNYEGV